MTDEQTEGRGDRLALMRIYDELDDAGKQELLRMAMLLKRRGDSPTSIMPDGLY